MDVAPSKDFFPPPPPPRPFFERHRRLVFWLAVSFIVLWMAAIFVGSTTLLSTANTVPIVFPLIERFFEHPDDPRIQTVHLVVRKMGHVAEYAILALLIAWACSHARQPGLRSWGWFPAALAVVAIYACTDEYHQTFVPGREGALRDVLIDVASGTAALLLLAGWRAVRRRRQFS